MGQASAAVVCFEARLEKRHLSVRPSGTLGVQADLNYALLADFYFLLQFDLF
jgi:hypothetical protein